MVSIVGIFRVSPSLPSKLSGRLSAATVCVNERYIGCPTFLESVLWSFGLGRPALGGGCRSQPPALILGAPAPQTSWLVGGRGLPPPQIAYIW